MTSTAVQCAYPSSRMVRMTAAIITQISDTGMRIFQPSAMNWS